MPTLFQDRVYKLCARIPKGRVTTYGEIARALNSKGFRAVGQALRSNPFAPVVPCHRVVASDGTLGGFMGDREGTALAKKKRLLAREGVAISGKRVRDFKKIFYSF
jgi:methylated-DNA-[protein]-cysteine S-methyltransferase